jgi:D-xylonolactonase
MFETVTEQRCTVGEGPLWHPDDGRVYWVDNVEGRMYRYDPRSDGTERFYEGEVVGAFTIQTDSSLLLFMGEGRVARWDDGNLTTVVDGIPREAGMRFNDVVADPRGRVFCGTIDDDDPTAGRLYRLDTDGSSTEVLESVELANGMGFTPDREGFYLTESNTNTIHEFRYDASTGTLADREVFGVRSGPGMYDGLTVDADGAVWSVLWDHGTLVRHDPEGSVQRTIEFPVRNATNRALRPGSGRPLDGGHGHGRGVRATMVFDGVGPRSGRCTSGSTPTRRGTGRRRARGRSGTPWWGSGGGRPTWRSPRSRARIWARRRSS